MNEIILVTTNEYKKGEPVFRAATELNAQPAAAPEAELAAAVAASGARAVIVGNEKYSGPLYEALAANAAGGGALIARFGVGHDGIDKPLARRHGILVTNTPGVLDVSVAEITLGLICALARHLAASDASFRAGEFSAPMGMELRGKTLGIIGFGGIGRRVAAMAHAGFGMAVLALGASPPDELVRREGRSLDEVLAAYGAQRYTDDLESVLREADIVSLHIPATPETRHLISAERLARMKHGALLINTARGAVMDEVAVYDALASGYLGGAALDVFEHEPYRPVAPDKDLRTLPNVLLTPHVGSNTREANTRMAQAALENVGHFFAGRVGEMTRVEA